MFSLEFLHQQKVQTIPLHGSNTHTLTKTITGGVLDGVWYCPYNGEIVGEVSGYNYWDVWHSIGIGKE